jgi:hypothetical protein
MSNQLDQPKDGGENAGPVAFAYERPVLTPVGNLHDLLAAGGTQNFDPGGGCQSGGVVFNGPICT